MPYLTELTEDYMGVIHTGTGVVTGEEVLRGCQSVSQLVENTENFHYKFVDLAEATGIEMTEEDLQEIVAVDRMMAYFRPHATVVIVAPDERLFAVAKQWENLVGDLGWATHVSRERSEALAWLQENYPAEPVKR